MDRVRGVPPPGAIRLRDRRVAREMAQGMRMLLKTLQELGHPALRSMQ